VSPDWAAPIAARRDPGPLSFRLVTVSVLANDGMATNIASVGISDSIRGSVGFLTRFIF
jgi:hypothetical protein